MDTTLNNIVAFRIVASDRTIPVNQDQETIEKAVECFSGFYLTLADGSYYVEGRRSGKDQWSKSVRIPFVKGNSTGAYQAQNAGIGSTNQTNSQPSESYLQKQMDKLEDKYDKALEKIESLKDKLQEEKDKTREAKQKNKDTDFSELMKPEAIAAIGNIIGTLRGVPVRAPMVGTMDGSGTTPPTPQADVQAPIGNAIQLRMQRILNAAAVIEQSMGVDMCDVMEKLAVMAETDPARLQMALQFLG
jgi:hypothetical protein